MMLMHQYQIYKINKNALTSLKILKNHVTNIMISPLVKII